MTTLLLFMLLGLAAAVVAIGAVALLNVTINRAEVGATLVFLSAIAQAVYIYDVPSVRVGGMRVGVTDVVVTIVLAAAVARCLRLRRFSRYLYWLAMLATLLLVSLVLGIANYGQASVSDARQYLFFVGAALYMATFRPTADLYGRIGRIWFITAILMVLLACVRWLDVFGGIHLGVPAERNGVDTAVRVLDGPYAFFLTGPLLLSVPFWRRRHPGWIRIMGGLLLIVLIVLDRRTAWLAVLVGVAVLLLRGRKLRASSIALVVVASIVTAVSFAGDVVARDDAPPGGVTSTGSVTWRLEGWSDLVDSWSVSPANWLIGEPFGSGFARTVDGSTVTAHPHNFYIETMIRAGVGGLIALLAVTVGLLWRLWKVRGRRNAELFDPSLLAPLLAMQLVWYLTWIPGLEQGLVTGMAIAVTAALPRKRPARTSAQVTVRRPRLGSGYRASDAAYSTEAARVVARPPGAAQPSRDAFVEDAMAAAVEARGPRPTPPETEESV